MCTSVGYGIMPWFQLTQWLRFISAQNGVSVTKPSQSWFAEPPSWQIWKHDPHWHQEPKWEPWLSIPIFYFNISYQFLFITHVLTQAVWAEVSPPNPADPRVVFQHDVQEHKTAQGLPIHSAYLTSTLGCASAFGSWSFLSGSPSHFNLFFQQCYI